MYFCIFNCYTITIRKQYFFTLYIYIHNLHSISTNYNNEAQLIVFIESVSTFEISDHLILGVKLLMDADSQNKVLKVDKKQTSYIRRLAARLALHTGALIGRPALRHSG